jgi:hypothetical protein
VASQIGYQVFPRVDGAARDGAEPSPRERVAKLLRDPKGYFDDARRWASGKARADVARELSEREAHRSRRSSLLRALGFARG